MIVAPKTVILDSHMISQNLKMITKMRPNTSNLEVYMAERIKGL